MLKDSLEIIPAAFLKWFLHPSTQETRSPKGNPHRSEENMQMNANEFFYQMTILKIASLFIRASPPPKKLALTLRDGFDADGSRAVVHDVHDVIQR